MESFTEINEICKERIENILESKSDSDTSTNKESNLDFEQETNEKIINNDKKNKYQVFTEKMLLIDDEELPINVREEFKNLDGTVLFVYDKMKQRKKDASKTITDVTESEKIGIGKRLQESDKTLSELIQLGTELVTNVKVANEKREVVRRNDEARRREELLQDLRNESTKAIEKFEAISEKWIELQNIKEPMGLHENLQLQKERIAELMKQKDDIIAECQQEIRRADKVYSDDLQQQNADICSLVERIDNQIELIKTAYNDHIELLQQTIELERENMANKATKNWETLHNKMSENENIKMTNEKLKTKQFEDEIERITLEHEELIRATRIRLETEAEKLQLELRSTKNNVFLNTEKLNYNFLVLQKRDEENTMIRNQQKKRLDKLTETIFVLNKKIEETKIISQSKLKRLNNEIHQLQKNCNELQLKMDNFHVTDTRKLQSIWEIYDQEARTLIQEILDIDKFLYEKQLGLKWIPPSQDLFPKIDIDTDKDVDQKLKSSLEMKSNGHPHENMSKTDEEKLANNKLLRNILFKIADRAGFLIEDTLLTILKPYTETQSTFVKIENIFTALDIQTPNDIENLTEYFIPYSWCPNCNPSGLSKELITKEIQNEFEETILCSDKEQEQDEITEIISKPKRKICSNHNLVIEPSLVLVALKKFIQNKEADSENSYRLSHEEKALRRNHSGNNKVQNAISIALQNMSKNEIQSYWSKYRDIFPESKQKLWKFLENGLNHYLKVLREREELNDQCKTLKRQNMELHHLLGKYNISSPEPQ